VGFPAPKNTPKPQAGPLLPLHPGTGGVLWGVLGVRAWPGHWPAVSSFCVPRQGNGHERDFMGDKRVYIMDVYNRHIYPGDRFAKRECPPTPARPPEPGSVCRAAPTCRALQTSLHFLIFSIPGRGRPSPLRRQGN